MAYNLVRLSLITGEKRLEDYAKGQLQFMSAEARRYPAGYAMFLMALSDHTLTSDKVTVVTKMREEIPENISCKVPLNAICIIAEPSDNYKLKNDKTTFYVCRGHQCLSPVNDLAEVVFNY